MWLNQFKWVVLAVFLVGCQPSARDLVQHAEEEVLQHRGQLARHLFIQVIDSHDTKDSLRFRALKGLTLLSFTQLQDYQTGLKVLDRLIYEFGDAVGFQSEIRALRFMGSQVSRIQTQNTDRALNYIEIYKSANNLSAEEAQELGRTLLAAQQWEEAEDFFERGFEAAIASNHCALAQALQLDVMQIMTLQKKCPETIAWARKKLFDGCDRLQTSIDIERAICYEYEGEVAEAIKIYETMLRENPKNTRAHFLLESIRKRQQDMQRR
jgi:tetratricopeptide (TPR) repeat protein